MPLVQQFSSVNFGPGTSYDLEILHQCGKKVQTKSQKVVVADSSVCRRYWGKEFRGYLGPFQSSVREKFP